MIYTKVELSKIWIYGNSKNEIMKNNLSILLVEDSSGDARLMRELLIEGGHLKPDFIFLRP